MTDQAGNLTFAIIKPDAVRAGHTGKIIDRIISDSFNIRAMKMIHQSRAQRRLLRCATGQEFLQA